MLRSATGTLVYLAFAVHTACTAPPDETWHAQTVLIASDGLGGCAAGDLTDRHGGDEIAASAGDGKIYVAGSDSQFRWQHVIAAELPGEMIQVAVGDAIADHPLMEIAAVGMAQGPERSSEPGAAYVLWADGDEWKHEQICADDKLLHGVCIADVDPAVPGAEIYVTGFTNQVHQVVRENGAWRIRASAPITGPGKNATPYRGGVAIAGSDGKIHLCKPTDGGIACELLHDAGAGVARLCAHGDHLLFCCDDGSLRLLTGDKASTLHSEDLKLRGAVIGDLDPRHAGLEAVTAGYSGKLTILAQDNGKWTPVHTFQDSASFHHVAAGNFDANEATTEIVAVGHSKNVTVFRKKRSP